MCRKKLYIEILITIIYILLAIYSAKRLYNIIPKPIWGSIRTTEFPRDSFEFFCTLYVIVLSFCGVKVLRQIEKILHLR